MRVLGDVVLVRYQHDRVSLRLQTIEECQISFPVCESRFPVGSSARMIDGRFTSARAIRDLSA